MDNMVICDRVDIDCPSGRNGHCNHNAPHVYNELCDAVKCGDLPRGNDTVKCIVVNNWIDELFEGVIDGYM